MTAPRPGGSGTLGAILAGGLARRMGGGDKGLRRIGGRTILDREARRLGPQCEALVLNANGDPLRFAELGLPVVADSLPDTPGPLAGILAALDWAAAHRPDLHDLVSVAGDTPFLPEDLVARLQAARREGRTALACASSGSRLHPIHGLWPVSLREELRSALLAGQRQVRPWMEARGLAVADWAADEWPGREVDPFFNTNSEPDLAEAERLAAIVDQGRKDP